MSGTITVGDKILASHDNVSGKLSMSGDVDMSNMVFPAGHVIQTQFNNGISNAHEVDGSGTTQTSSFLSDSITTTVANSKILVMYSTYGSHTQSGTKGQVWLQRTIDGVATQINQETTIKYWANYSSNYGTGYSPIHICFMDSPNVAVGTQITYASRFKRAAGSNSFYYVHDQYLYQTILQEIMP